jgi:hypothetical protein
MIFQSGGRLSQIRVALIVFLTVSGCAAGFKVETHTDADGAAISNTVGNEILLIGGAKDNPGLETKRFGKRCFLDVRRSKDKHGIVTYFLVLTYIGPYWVNIDVGPSMDLVIDDKSKSFSSKGPLKKEEGINGFIESLDYTVSHKVLTKVVNAERIEVKISAEHGDILGYFTAKNFAIFKKFMDTYAESDM